MLVLKTVIYDVELWKHKMKGYRMNIKSKWVLVKAEDFEEMEKSLAELEKLVHGCFYSHEQDGCSEDFGIEQVNGVYHFN